MNNARKALIGLFISIIIVSTLVHTVLAQKNETIDILQQENKTTTAQNATFSEVTQKSEITKEEIIIEAQRSFDRSLSILNIVAASMAVLVGLITIIIIIAIAVGIFEYSKWKAIRIDIEKKANAISELKNKMEEIVSTSREKLGKIPQPSLSEKPSKEVLDKLDEFSRKMELLEILGASLKPEDYYNRGNDFYFKGKYELAIKAYEKAIELKPDYAYAWCNKGAALADLGRHDEALKVSERAIELKPDDAYAWCNKGVALVNLGRYDEAIKASEMAIELKPDYANAWYNKGAALADLGRYDEAIKAYGKAIELKPDFSDAWCNKGAALVKLSRNDEAIKAYDKAIELKPDFSDAWCNKGAALVNLGRYDEAIKAYDKAIELKPDYANAWYNRACVYSKKEEKEKALSDLKNAIGIDMSFKEKAKKEKDFEKLWDDKDFKKLVV